MVVNIFLYSLSHNLTSLAAEIHVLEEELSYYLIGIGISEIEQYILFPACIVIVIIITISMVKSVLKGILQVMLHFFDVIPKEHYSFSILDATDLSERMKIFIGIHFIRIIFNAEENIHTGS